MSGTYLTWLADELRAAGLKVVEYDGWKTRARSSGGFASGRPFGVWWHHTASNTTPQNDAHYMCHGSDSRPIANVLIARTGEVWVLAAGATNTNGKGKQVALSRGVVPQDQANTHVFGMEIANTGVGEPYPQAQIDAAFTVSNTVNRKMGNQPSDVCTHQDYAPDRKIDPATTSALSGWQPRSVNSSGSWHCDDLRAECSRRGAPPRPTPPPLEDDDIMLRAAKNRDTGNTFLIGDGTTAQTMDGLDATETALRVAGGVIDVSTKKIVYSWNNVTPIPGGECKKYVGAW